MVLDGCNFAYIRYFIFLVFSIFIGILRVLVVFFCEDIKEMRCVRRLFYIWEV